MRDWCVNIISKIIINYQDFTQVKCLLEGKNIHFNNHIDTLYDERMVIDELADNDIFKAFDSRKPLVYVHQIWLGVYERELFLNYSINFKIIRDVWFKYSRFVNIDHDYEHNELSIMNAIDKYTKNKNGGKLKKKQKIIPKINSHMFMFKIWKETMATRYLIDALFIIIIALLMQIITNDVQENTRRYYLLYADYITKQTALNNASTNAERDIAQQEFNTIENELLDCVDYGYELLTIIWVYFIILIAYFIRNIWQIIYAKLRVKKWKVILPELVVSSFHLFLTVLLTIRWNVDYIHANPEDPRYYKNYLLSKAYDEKFLSMDVLMALYMATQWVRILFIFKVSQLLGPMLSILYSMLFNIVKLMSIYWLVLLVFASSGRLFFVQIEQYETYIDSVITLFSASLGNFSFSIYEDPRLETPARYGYTFIIAYLIITNIILLNFIISVLSLVYDQIRELGNLVYLAEVIKTRSVFGYNKYYSSMVSFFIPLNSLFIPFIPFLIILKSEKLNNMLLHIAYIPVLCIALLMFIVCSVVLLPFAYLGLIYQNVLNCFGKCLVISDRLYLLYILLWGIIKDPFALWFITILDIFRFTKSLYASNFKIHEDGATAKIQDMKNLDREYFVELKKRLLKYKNKLIDIRHLIKELRDEFKVLMHIKWMIYESFKEKSSRKYGESETNGMSEGISTSFRLQSSK